MKIVGLDVVDGMYATISKRLRDGCVASQLFWYVRGYLHRRLSCVSHMSLVYVLRRTVDSIGNMGTPVVFARYGAT